jgi:hypothetical protein
MNRSARSLLGVAAVAPFAAVLAVAAAPANAAPGPSTALLYDTAAAAYPATRTLPDPVVQTGGQTAEKITGTGDGVLRAAPGARRAGARGTDALPAPDGAAGTLLKDVRKAGDTVRNSKIGRFTGMRPAFSAGRRADMPVSMALPADAAGTLGSAWPGGLPVGSVLFPVGDRHATPVPSDDVVGQANGAVNEAGEGLGRTEQGVGNVVDVLKAKDPAARPADGPLSMPDATALGLPRLPGIG